MVTAAAAGLSIVCNGASVGVAERLFREGRWFELRQAVTDSSPPLLQAAVATAFNDRARAESLLWNVVETKPNASAVDSAYELLCRIYRRTGQYARLAGTHKAWASAYPDSPGARRWSEDRAMFSRPDQVNDVPTRAVLEHPRGGFPTLPVSVNGIQDDFILDTGAWQSALTESEARKLGVVVREEAATLIDSSGTPTTFRTAVVEEVAIGPLRFRNVSFAVIGSSSPIGSAELGIIGMPILLAIGAIQWSTDGTVELAATPKEPPDPAPPNLAFDRSRLLLSTEVLGQPVMAVLDTGANTTALNANFADSFPQLVAKGKRETEQFTGIGGSQTFESIRLPELSFRIGPASVTLRPVSITLQRLDGLGGECCVGNAGHDLLIQGRGFAIDFSRMTLGVR
jgi:predicted aspartyl protease